MRASSDRFRTRRSQAPTAAVRGGSFLLVSRAQPTAGVPRVGHPYRRLTDLTRGPGVEAARMQEFVSGLGLSAEAQARLLALTPGSYIGIAPALVDHLAR